MHKIAKQILDKYKARSDVLDPAKKAALAMKAIFKLPIQDMALRTLDSWGTTAGIRC